MAANPLAGGDCDATAQGSAVADAEAEADGALADTCADDVVDGLGVTVEPHATALSAAAPAHRSLMTRDAGPTSTGCHKVRPGRRSLLA
ncbi:MAG: hypothetical protein M3019_09110 [Candidatus Dormibacteraeota bacterium]|nr:hypothetical protein [Candidatus Dormibacteraeota bacterium]